MSEPLTADDTRRTAATWVAGTGAFLLLVAATVFTAVRWDELPALAKLGILLGGTAAFLAGGRALRRTLPGTGAAVLHLGTLLVPLDAAAIALHLQLGWPGVLLVAGLAGAVTFPLVERALDSVVLRTAGALAAVAAIAGLAGASPLPAGPALATLAVAALVAGGRRPAVAWAVVAGLSPLLVVVPAPVLGGGVVRDLGLAGAGAEVLALLTGALAAFVLAREARRLDDPAPAFAAVVMATLGLATTWITQLSGVDDGLSLAAGFLVAELVALAVRRDRLWRPVADLVVGIIEVGAALLGCYVALWCVLLGLLWPGAPDPWAVVWFGLLALGWLTADLRRQQGRPGVALGLLVGGGWAPAVPLFAVSVVALGSGSLLVEGAVLLALTGLALATARPGAHVTGAVTAIFVPLVLWDRPVLAGGAGLAAAVLLAEMAVLRVRSGAPRPGLTLGPAVATVAMSAMVVGAASDDRFLLVAAVAFAAGTWLVAALVDRASVPLGHAVRIAGLAGLALVPWSPSRAAVLGGVVLVLLAIDCLRLREPRLVLAAAAVLPYGLVGLLVDRGIGEAFAGVGVALAGLVVAGLAAVVDDERWRQQLALAALVLEGIGVAVAAADLRALGDALLVAGGVVLAGGLAVRRDDVAHVGAAALTAGLWVHLSASHVAVTELYAAPVAAQLLVVGVMLRRRAAASSWVAYGPALALAGGLPLAERLGGGGAGHALAAGAVGVVALVAGGHRRLAAPLVLGTGLCVALAGYEALAVTATVPTWGWLALAGSVLLGAGITIERTGVSPVASGRRLADVIVDQFD